MAAKVEERPAEEALEELSATVGETLETSAETAAASAQAAVAKEIQITRLIEHEPVGSARDESLASRGDLASSIEADVGSSVALSEKLDAFRDVSGAASEAEADSVQGSRASEASWSGKPHPPSQPKAIWQHRYFAFARISANLRLVRTND